VPVVEFLVIRRPAVPAALQTQSITPMELDGEDSEAAESMTTDAPTDEDEPLPTIAIGSENWHNNFSAPWIPVIHRDISRQRRQSPQRAFSDSYLSGMSSKRRKLISGAKPSAAEPNSMLGQGVRQVLQNRTSRFGGSSSGASSSSSTAATISSLNEAIASNQHIQEPYGSYEQAILDHVQNRLSNDVDYSPERFPNVTKWIEKNK